MKLLRIILAIMSLPLMFIFAFPIGVYLELKRLIGDDSAISRAKIFGLQIQHCYVVFIEWRDIKVISKKIKLWWVTGYWPPVVCVVSIIGLVLSSILTGSNRF